MTAQSANVELGKALLQIFLAASILRILAEIRGVA